MKPPNKNRYCSLLVLVSKFRISKDFNSIYYPRRKKKRRKTLTPEGEGPGEGQIGLGLVDLAQGFSVFGRRSVGDHFYVLGHRLKGQLLHAQRLLHPRHLQTKFLFNSSNIIHLMQVKAKSGPRAQVWPELDYIRTARDKLVGPH